MSLVDEVRKVHVENLFAGNVRGVSATYLPHFEKNLLPALTHVGQATHFVDQHSFCIYASVISI